MRKNNKNFQAVYLIFLGLQFNRSEHRPVKAEAAGSSPVSPDESKSNKKLYQFISLFFVKRSPNNIISFPTVIPLLFFFFVSHLSSTKWGVSISSTSTDSIDGREAYVDQYNYYIISIRFRIPRDTVLYWVWLFQLLPICEI